MKNVLNSQFTFAIQDNTLGVINEIPTKTTPNQNE